jgi:hypothetical protein
MHHFPYPSYLRTHRDRWALSQPELAALLGSVSPSLVSKCELFARTPNVETIIGSEFIFGEPARRLFPALYASVELKVTLQAALMAEALAGNKSKKALLKRELLEAIARRAASDQPIL